MSEREAFVRNNIDIRRQQIADGVNMVSKERMEAEIAAFEEELNSISAKQAEEEKRVDALQQQIQEMDLLGSILPEAQLINTNVSLTEYGMMRQEMNQFLHAWAMDIEKSVNEVRDIELNEVVAKLQQAQDENLRLQNDNRNLQSDISERTEREERFKTRISELESDNLALKQSADEVNPLKDQIANLQKIIESKNEKIAGLKDPKLTAISRSASVQEQLEGMRKRSQETFLEKANRGLERWSLPPIESPTVPKLDVLQEVSQQEATFPAVEPTSDQLLPAETVENINPFRTEEIPSGLENTQGGTDQGVQESFEQWATREINELKAWKASKESDWEDEAYRRAEIAS